MSDRDLVVITFVDITGRKRAEERQRASERRLVALVEGIPELVWRAADDGQWTWASPHWSAYTGQNEARSRKHGWFDALRCLIDLPLTHRPAEDG